MSEEETKEENLENVPLEVKIVQEQKKEVNEDIDYEDNDITKHEIEEFEKE